MPYAGRNQLSIAAPSQVAVLEDETIKTREVHPEDAGLPVHPFAAILGGTPEENGKAFAALLAGEASAYRDAVLLNSAAALVVADKATDLKSGVEMAAASIDSGAAKAKIEGLAKLTSEAA